MSEVLVFYDWSAVMDRYWLFKEESEEESCLSFGRAAGKKERSSACSEVISQLRTYGLEFVVRPVSVVLW